MKKEIWKQGKRVLAAVLAAAMTISGVPAMGGLTSKAAELENNAQLMDGRPYSSLTTSHYYSTPQKSYGNSDSTGYVFGKSGTSTSIYTTQYSFDFSALPKAINTEPTSTSEEGYELGHAANLRTSFSFGWWNTFFQFTTDQQGTNNQANNKDDGTSVIVPHYTGTDTTRYTGSATAQAKLPQVLSPTANPEKKNGEVTTAEDPANSANKVEVRPEIKVSADKKWLIVQYTVYNTTGSTQDFWIGNECDTMIYNHDGCPTVVSTSGTAGQAQGLHLIAHAGSTYNLTSLDILTYSPDGNAGMETRDNTDPSKLFVWSGYWSSTAGVNHNNWVFASDEDQFKQDGHDAAAAFSAYFNLLPHETKTARFAVSMRTNTYYVDAVNGSDSNDGFISAPVKTIEKAVDLADNAGTKKAYIFLMTDCTIGESTNPLADPDFGVQIPNGLDITISTTDFDEPVGGWGALSPSNPPVRHDVTTPVKKVTRAPGFNGYMFSLGGPSEDTGITFTDVVIDGSDTTGQVFGSVVLADNGTVKTQVGAVIENNTINDSYDEGTTRYYPALGDPGNGIAPGTKFEDLPDSYFASIGTTKTDYFQDDPMRGSVFDIHGTGKINMNNGTIQNNKALSGAAVNFQGAVGNDSNDVTFKVENNVIINNNDNDSGTNKGNVYLGTGNMITAVGALPTTAIMGVSVADPPATTTAERPVLQKLSTIAGMPFSASNVSADLSPDNWTMMGTLPANTEKVVLQAAIKVYTAKYIYQNSGVDTELQSATSASYPVGLDMTQIRNGLGAVTPTFDTLGNQIMNYAPTIAGFVLDRTVIEPSTVTTLSASTAALTKGDLTGNMPREDVTVTYYYVENLAKYHFDTVGGLSIADMTESVNPAAVVSTLSMPTPVRAGYDFVNWYDFTSLDANGNGVLDAGEWTDTNGNGQFDAGETAGMTLATAFPAPTTAGVHSYVAEWNVGAGTYNVIVKHQNKNPSLPITFGTDTTGYPIAATATASPAVIPGYLPSDLWSDQPTSGGADFDTVGNYSHVMGAQGVNVFYSYGVDSTQNFTFRVVHQTTGGSILQDNSVNRRAEQAISAAPISQYGITFASVSVTTGETDGAPGSYVVGTTTMGCTFDAANNFNGHMPNQDVVVTYVYTSTAPYFVNSKFMDADNANRVIKVDSMGANAEDVLAMPAPNVYGYMYTGGATAEKSDPSALGTVGTFDALGAYSGQMPYCNLGLSYPLHRDPAFWSTITFAVGAAPYNNGSIGMPTSSSFLRDDGSAAAADPVTGAYTFDKMDSLGLVPAATASPLPYYRFAGWFTDSACTIPVTGTMTFPGDTTVYAKFEEDPAFWIDINFVSGAHGTIGTPTALHTYFDNTWGAITALLPATTPELNYLFSNWTDASSNVMGAASTLTGGMTYTANFIQDPSVWGTGVGGFDPMGQIGPDGSGEIRVHGTQANDIYIVTDLSGNIIATLPAPSPASDITFTDLYPGTRYNVYEGTPDTVATVGQNISTATGTQISAPQEVLIPTVDWNYTFGYDDQEEGKVQMVINPADPDSDYALIDENGNVVIPDGSPDGWLTPEGSAPATVTFHNLNAGEQYTVVARKKGDTAVTPLSKLPDGTLVVANPGDNFEIPKFVVETKNGMIMSVAGNAIGSDRFDTAHEREEVVIHADAVNASGQIFQYWKVINGHCTGITGRVTSTDVTFTMDASNVVLSAVYAKDPLATPATADVEEEVKGGSAGDFALEPSDIASLEQQLTTDQDRALITVNGADVTYRIVFNKRDTTNSESALVKPVSISGIDHPDAYTNPWSLDIIADRYVNGRKVGRATPSDASTGVIVQLNAEDVDMMDYELFDITTGTPVPMTFNAPDNDPENMGGLFTFTGNVGHTYVMVYSRAYKLRFIDNNPVLNYLHLNDMTYNYLYMFKVRRKEAPTDSWYNTDYDTVCAYANEDVANALETPFFDILGYEHTYVNWSKKNMPAKISVFDPDAPVTKTTVLYAYYNDDHVRNEQARVDLTDLISEAWDVTGNPYLKQAEVDELIAQIAVAQGVLDWLYPVDPRRANYYELQQAFDDLKALLDRLYKLIDERTNKRLSSSGGSSGGGSGSGGKGIGTSSRPFENSNVGAFTLGVDGFWSQNSNGTWSFVLNGGLPLNDRWGKIQFADETGKLITKWYFFNGAAEMQTGWMHDTNSDKWYYLSAAAGSTNGQMLIGWYKDTDGNWYYLDPVLGEMYLGWHRIGDFWYYFTPTTMSGHPTGSLFVNTTTPDGYQVNHDGEWTV